MLILKLHLNPWLKWTPFKLNASCTSSNNIITSCHIHASYCCICLCLIVGTVLLDRSSSGDRSRVPVRGAVLCTLFYQASKPPLVHSDTIPLSLLLPVIALGQQRFQLLLYAAVVEPIPLHDLYFHSK